MTDIVERLRDVIDALRQELAFSQGETAGADALHEAEKQMHDKTRQQLAYLGIELSQRQEDIHELTEELSACKKVEQLILQRLSDIAADWTKTQQQLAEEHEAHLIAEQKWIEEMVESQAREKALRDASKEAILALGVTWVSHHANRSDSASDALTAALAQPADDTAIKAALAAERERCAKKAEQLGKDLAELNEDNAMKFAGGSIACAIRALGEE